MMGSSVQASTQACTWKLIDVCGEAWSCLPISIRGGQKRPFEKAIYYTVYYQPILEAPRKYEVLQYVDDYHWYLLFHCIEKDTNYPYIRLEITTDKTREIIREMIVLFRDGDNLTSHRSTEVQSESEDGGERGDGGESGDGATEPLIIPLSKLQNKGTVTRSIRWLCKKADEVRDEMNKKGYKLATSNCQQFTNNVLEQLGLEITPTWVGPHTTRCTKCTIPEYPHTPSATGGDGGACV